MKISGGVFDGRSADWESGRSGAARVQIDFWDAEAGYYLNGTYYGDKNMLAIGGATQLQDGHTATTSISCSKRSCQRRSLFYRKRIFQLQPAGRI